MNWLKVVVPAAMLVAVGSIGACAPVAQQQAPWNTPITPVAAATDDATCFTSLAPEHRQQLAQYVVPQSGTGQNVCVLEQEADGEYEQQYYNEGDNFPDFWYYVLLSRTAAMPAFKAGIIAEPTPVEYLTLMYMTPVDKYGAAYSVYELDKRTGKWSARKAEKPMKLKQVRYGASAPVQLNMGKTPPPAPNGYARQVPQASQGSASVGRPVENRDASRSQTQKPSNSSTSKSSSSSSSSRSSGKSGK